MPRPKIDWSINLKGLTRFTFDEYCKTPAALFDWMLRTYYIKPIAAALDKPTMLSDAR